MKKMHFTISKDGDASVKVEGAVGQECEEFTRAFEEAVGDLTKREHTEDYHRDVVDIQEDVRQDI